MNETRINPTYKKELDNYSKYPILRYNQCINKSNKPFIPFFNRTKPINNYQQFLNNFGYNNCCIDDNYSLNYHKEFKNYHIEKQIYTNKIQNSILEDYNIMFNY